VPWNVPPYSDKGSRQILASVHGAFLNAQQKQPVVWSEFFGKVANVERRGIQGKKAGHRSARDEVVLSA